MTFIHGPRTCQDGFGLAEATDAAQLKEFQQIGTSTWSDILDELGVEGVIGGLARRGGEGGFAAFAVTAKAQAGPLGASCAKSSRSVGCRDVEEIRDTGLWLASRHVTPMTGKRRIRIESMGERISIGGVNVAPGDLLVGDDTGIVVIPRQYQGAALEMSRRMIGMDQEIERAIRSGASFREAARSANYI